MDGDVKCKTISNLLSLTSTTTSDFKRQSLSIMKPYITKRPLLTNIFTAIITVIVIVRNLCWRNQRYTTSNTNVVFISATLRSGRVEIDPPTLRDVSEQHALQASWFVSVQQALQGLLGLALRGWVRKQDHYPSCITEACFCFFSLRSCLGQLPLTQLLVILHTKVQVTKSVNYKHGFLLLCLPPALSCAAPGHPVHQGTGYKTCQLQTRLFIIVPATSSILRSSWSSCAPRYRLQNPRLKSQLLFFHLPGPAPSYAAPGHPVHQGTGYEPPYDKPNKDSSVRACANECAVACSVPNKTAVRVRVQMSARLSTVCVQFAHQDSGVCACTCVCVCVCVCTRASAYHSLMLDT